MIGRWYLEHCGKDIKTTERGKEAWNNIDENIATLANESDTPWEFGASELFDRAFKAESCFGGCIGAGLALLGVWIAGKIKRKKRKDQNTEESEICKEIEA